MNWFFNLSDGAKLGVYYIFLMICSAAGGLLAWLD